MTAEAKQAGRLLACVLALATAGLVAVAAATPAARAAGRPAREIVRVRQLRHAAARPASQPARGRAPAIAIPAIGVRASLATLGDPSTAKGAGGLLLPVPPLAKAAVEAGWYRFTAVPGAAGNAVIAGHVDTYAGPGVFYALYLLRRGDAVYVTAGNRRQRFTVTTVKELPKDDFPVNQVFGATSKHRLWLITCGGDFDYATGHYLENIVVSASWNPAEMTSSTDERDRKAAANRPKDR
jgi:LPXTG-site transpeptidase (sortase) family protein